MRQPWIDSSQTTHGSPLTPESLPFWRSRTTPMRIQVRGNANLPPMPVSFGFPRTSCANEMLTAKALAPKRKSRYFSFINLIGLPSHGSHGQLLLPGEAELDVR